MTWHRRRILMGVGLMTLLLVALLIWLSKEELAPSNMNRAESVARTPDSLSPASSPAEPCAHNDVDLESYAGELDSIAEEVSQQLRPLWPWSRMKFDGKAKYMSASDLEVAERIVYRHLANFGRIDQLDMTVSEATTVLDEGDWGRQAREQLQLVGGASQELALSVRREPMYLRAEGIRDGKQINAVTTEVGDFNDKLYGKSKSLWSHYLDGELWFTEYSLLKFADHVYEDVGIDMPLPQMDDLAEEGRVRKARYDVIEDAKPDVKMVKRYYFNRETGLLDLFVVYKVDESGERKGLHACGIVLYEESNGVKYPRKYRLYGQDYRLKTEYEASGIKIIARTAD